ncbi:UvrD-helicase domain-containing protein [Paraliobacillus zengyii]|uniref:UvrD-helicase domain-containing protein n=1 Tax=Paraliobacillus zengyii TaxID=2213194 RepID=UPI000DD4B9B5|nr:UvrD-helicase domain-containing protein [Paraliobacillus zengyii]
MKLIDKEDRDAILEDNRDIVVSASAGSGKTTIMVKKMIVEIEKIKDHRTLAAITFTVKATEEIKKKIKEDIKKTITVMTNDSFIENEIIRPFIKDALGMNFKNDYSVEYEDKYKFDDFESGLEQLENNNILGSFEDKKQNFKFRLAYEILENSKAAQEYLKAKYSWIFIDEYQDSDNDMHLFFMKLKNELKLKLFIVGDAKQAIYLWRGAMSNVFDLLKIESFSFYKLITNFRCDKEIENYANLFDNPQYFMDTSEYVENVVFKEYNPGNFYDRRNFIGFEQEFKSLVSMKELDLNNEITIISNFNNDAKKITELLNQEGFDFVFIPKTPIDEGIPNGYLLKELALFIKNSNSTYSIFDFLENNYIDERIGTRFEVNKIIEKLRVSEDLTYKKVEEIVYELADYLEISIEENEINKFNESIFNSNYDMAFRIIESKHKVMTVFASKGLEFDQVITFARYYKIYNEEHVQNHYVCITRAKEKFIMFIDDTEYYEHVSKIAYENGIEDSNTLFKYE